MSGIIGFYCVLKKLLTISEYELPLKIKNLAIDKGVVLKASNFTFETTLK